MGGQFGKLFNDCNIKRSLTRMRICLKIFGIKKKYLINKGFTSYYNIINDRILRMASNTRIREQQIINLKSPGLLSLPG